MTTLLVADHDNKTLGAGVAKAMSAAKEKFGNDYDVCGRDGVHPGPNGHLLMAYAFLKGLGLDGNLATITIANAVVGAVTGIVMWLCGLGGPLLWGTIAFLLNFVPILGPTAGVMVFLVAGLATIDPLWAAFLPAVLYLLIHVIEGETVTPMLLAAARALAGVVSDDERNAAYIVPSVFHPGVTKAVASAVERVAREERLSAGSSVRPMVDRPRNLAGQGLA